MGFAGNKEPQFIMPSAIAVKETAKVTLCLLYLFKPFPLAIENYRN